MAVSQSRHTYRNGEMIHCERCNRLVRVKLYDKGEVVVVSAKEQKELALRCQYCDYLLCDDCAHLNASLTPVCPNCQREWGPYYFTHGESESGRTVAPVPAFRNEPALPAPRQSVFSATMVSPDRISARGHFRLLTRERIAGFLLAAGLLILGVFFFLGPGAPWLEKSLAALVATPTMTAPATPIPAETEPSAGLSALARLAAFEQPTATPTRTATLAISATPSPAPLPSQTDTPSPTLLPDCTPVQAVTLDHVGQTLCVTGEITEANQRPEAFYVLFGKQSGELYMVSYDGSSTNLVPGMCIRVTGEVMKLGTTPVMVLSYSTPAEPCP